MLWHLRSRSSNKAQARPPRTAIDSYFADKQALGKTLNQEIANIPIPGGWAGPLASAIENALGEAASPSSDQQPASVSNPPVVPFGFLVGLLETVIEISHG